MFSKCIRIMLLLALVPTAVFAQGGGNTPRLTWEPVKGAGGYIIEIKNDDGDVIVEKKIKTAYYDITLLKKGAYKFRITTLNKFLKSENSTGWIPFEIQKAIIPDFVSVSTDVLYYNYDNNDIVINGDNFTSKTEVYIANASGKIKFNTVKIESEKTLRASISPVKSMRGDYQLIVQNPGGFEAEKKTKMSVVEPIEPDFDKADPPYVRQGKGKVTVDFICSDILDKATISLTGAGEKINYTIKQIKRDRITVEIDSDKAKSGYYDLVIKNPGIEKKFSGAFRIKEPVDGLLQWGGLYLGLGYEANIAVAEWMPVVKPSFIGAALTASYSFTNIAYLDKAPRAENFYMNFKFDYFSFDGSRKDNRIPSVMNGYRTTVGFSVGFPFRNFSIFKSPEVLLNLGCGPVLTSASGDNIHYSFAITSIDFAARTGLSFRSMLTEYIFFEPAVDANLVMYKGTNMIEISTALVFGLKL